MHRIFDVLSTFLGDLASYLPPGLVLSVATAFLEGGKYMEAFRHEFVGSLLMIGFTFSAGKWVGTDSLQVAWISHFMGVIAADYIGGGPHVNPAVTVAMFALSKVSYTEAYVRIAAQLGGENYVPNAATDVSWRLPQSAFPTPNVHFSILFLVLRRRTSILPYFPCNI